jgi:hypothetical protein
MSMRVTTLFELRSTLVGVAYKFTFRAALKALLLVGNDHTRRSGSLYSSAYRCASVAPVIRMKRICASRPSSVSLRARFLHPAHVNVQMYASTHPPLGLAEEIGLTCSGS